MRALSSPRRVKSRTAVAAPPSPARPTITGRDRRRAPARTGSKLPAVALRVRLAGRAHADLRARACEPARAAQGLLLRAPHPPLWRLARRQARARAPVVRPPLVPCGGP